MSIARLVIYALASLFIVLAANLLIVRVAYAATCYIDADGDGYGDLFTPPITDDSGECGPGFSAVSLDCNDDPAVQLLNGIQYTGLDFNPEIVEGFGTQYCGDGLDHNCDGAEGSSGGDDDEDGLTYNTEVSNFFAPLPDCDPDIDDDKLTDFEEFVTLGTSAENGDSDNDSVRDDVEVGGNIFDPLNTDGDGNIDALDQDDDNDGIPTIEESPDGDIDPTNDDTDDDNLPNYRDEDDDGDGYLTIIEDSNFDGDPTNDDSDDDTVPDYLDEDSDNDSVSDSNELDENSDASCDGKLCVADNLPNRIDEDDDGDSVPTIDESPDMDGDPLNDNTDAACTDECISDNLLDYLDVDDDGDGIPTLQEDWNNDGDPTNDDTDDDGVPDYLDKDPVPEEVFKDGFEDLVVS